MVLEKLQIWKEIKPESAFIPYFVALFNPNQVTHQKSSNWQTIPVAQSDSPASQFTYSNPATLSLQLFLDTYEKKISVRLLTDLIDNLVTVQVELHRPPLCQLIWGGMGGLQGSFFQGVLEQVSKTFTLFLPDGTPVRATVDCMFRELRSPGDEPRLESSDVTKSRTLRRGDTLSSMAGEEFGDPRMWRFIARANNIEDPLAIAPGQVVTIPALPARRGGGR